MKHSRANRWNDDMVVEGLRELAELVGHTPTTSEAGAKLANAAIRRFKSFGAACKAAGLVPNSQGGPPHVLKRKETGATVDPPAPKPTTFVTEVVVIEYQAHLARRRKQLAAEEAEQKRLRKLYGPRKRRKGRRGRSDFFGRKRWESPDDYLPPPDLLTFKGAA